MPPSDSTTEAPPTSVLALLYDVLCSHDCVPRYKRFNGTKSSKPGTKKDARQSKRSSTSRSTPPPFPLSLLAPPAESQERHYAKLFAFFSLHYRVCTPPGTSTNDDSTAAHAGKRQQRSWFHCAFSASSFTYSLVGLLMLCFFNRRLPAIFWRTSVINVDLYAFILVVQGFLSYWADVWARTIECAPQHVAYLADRAFAAPMTLLTLYLGIFCWYEPSTPAGRMLASCTGLGLVPFIGSQCALRLERYGLFMALHIGWHVSIPLVALLWLGHTTCGWFT